MSGETDRPDQSIHARALLDDVLCRWAELTPEGRVALLRSLPSPTALAVFNALGVFDQAEVIRDLSEAERRQFLSMHRLDDVTDILQAMPAELQESTLASFAPAVQNELKALLAYQDDVAGGIMNPHFLHLYPNQRVDEAIAFLRHRANESFEDADTAYVLDDDRRPIGQVSLRALLLTPGTQQVRDIMDDRLETVPVDMDQEEIALHFSRSRGDSLPVVDAAGRMVGLVTAQDVVEVLSEEATEDIQKLAGAAPTARPYLELTFLERVRSRAVWLVFFFLIGMLTVTVMGAFTHDAAEFAHLVLFVPLVISSGGNAGSQAATIIVRAIALGEVRLSQWWKVWLRELATGIAAGLLIGIVGFARVVLWPGSDDAYGHELMRMGVAVSAAIGAVVLWGTVAGAAFPFALKRLGFDPAASSAPFVSTTIDVTGLLIYFGIAGIILS